MSSLVDNFNRKSSILIFVLIVFFSGILKGQDRIRINLNETKLFLDEAVGYSTQVRAGHKNGNIDAGERVTFQVALLAMVGDFISTSVLITCNNKNINVITPKLSFDDIQEGSTVRANKKLIVEINPNAKHNELIKLDFKINDSQKRTSAGAYVNFYDTYSFKVNKVGPIQYGRAIIDDDNIGQSEGDGDGVIEKSDGDIEVPLILKNLGQPNINDVTVKLSSTIKNIRIPENTHRYNYVKGGGEGETAADYVFYIDERGARAIDFVPMKLTINGTYQGFNYNWIHHFKLGNVYGYLNVKVNNTEGATKVDGKLLYTTKKKFLANKDIGVSFTKPNFSTLSIPYVPIEENKTTYVEATLIEGLTPELEYVDYLKEKPYVSLTAPTDFANKRPQSDFYRKPANLRKETKYEGGFWYFISLSGAGWLLGTILTDNPGSPPSIIGAVGFPIIYLSSFKSILESVPNKKNIDFNKKQKEIATKKAIEVQQRDYQFKLEQAKVISEQRNLAINETNDGIKEENILIAQKNEVIKIKNEEIAILNETINKQNREKIDKELIRYKVGNGEWINKTPSRKRPYSYQPRPPSNTNNNSDYEPDLLHDESTIYRNYKGYGQDNWDDQDQEYKENIMTEEVIDVVEGEEIYTIVEKQPFYQGGMGAFYKYVSLNLKYPLKAKQLGIEGKVFVSFVVNTDGSISDVRSLRGIRAGCDVEAIRLIRNSPKWFPGVDRGKQVRVRMVLPITFKL